jgi:hypothetical protein
LKERFLLYSNIFCFLLIALIAATLQTSLWFQIAGYFPAPALWIPVLVYVSMHRNAVEMLVTLIFIAAVLSSMTTMSDGVLLGTCLFLGVAARIFKERIYWSSYTYSMLICGLSSFFFHFIKWLAAMALEEKQFFMPHVLDWLIEAMLTALAAPLMFRFLLWIDELFSRESVASTGKVV